MPNTEVLGPGLSFGRRVAFAFLSRLLVSVLDRVPCQALLQERSDNVDAARRSNAANRPVVTVFLVAGDAASWSSELS